MTFIYVPPVQPTRPPVLRFLVRWGETFLAYACGGVIIGGVIIGVVALLFTFLCQLPEPWSFVGVIGGLLAFVSFLVTVFDI